MSVPIVLGKLLSTKKWYLSPYSVNLGQEFNTILLESADKILLIHHLYSAPAVGWPLNNLLVEVSQTCKLAQYRCCIVPFLQFT